MPDGNGDRNFVIAAIVFCSLVLSVILFTSFQSGKYVGAQRQQQQENSTRYAAHAEEEIRQKCLGLIPVFQAKCIREIVEATREQDRAERDVVAQNEMALWALGMLVVTGLGVLLSGAAVWLLWRTLQRTSDIARDTKITADAAAHSVKHGEMSAQAALASATEAAKSNEISHRMRLDEGRPFVFVEPESNNVREWLNTHVSFDWPFTLVNYGRNPAIIDQVQFVCDISETIPPIDGVGLHHFRNAMVEWTVLREKEPKLIKDPTYFPVYRETGFSEDRSDFITGKNFLWLILIVKYRDFHNLPLKTLAGFQQRYKNYRVQEAGGRTYNYRT